MSTLVLLRHGQARAFEDDSDRLSDTGIKQARLAGKHLQTRRFDQVICGSLRRHRETADQAGFPNAVIDSRWNEFDSSGVLALARARVDFAALWDDFERHRRTPDANRYFQRLFEAAMARYIEGDLRGEGVETWRTFQDRVRAALTEIVDAPEQGRTVLVITSGGPIGTCVQTVLDAPVRKALEVNWRVRNASLTEFLYSRGRISLDLFNAVPHLFAELVTYR